MTDSKILYETKFLQLKEAASPAGHPWFYAHRHNVKGVVVIVPIINEKETVFLETRRPPIYGENIAQTCIEPPAGLVGDLDEQESFLEAAKKELLEETGYVAKNIKIVAKNSASSPGCTSEVFSLAIAEVEDETIHQDKITTDGGVIVERHKVALKDAKKWLAEQENLGKSISVQVYAGMWFIHQQDGDL